ncbi:16S rRNA (guanine(527)-N(7))-methyltransferase RsmG [Luteibaculum oceani]|uniref:Ribosomal RNA small subunit methyltransferase G n=1 Tax=Luteibaculum oceani TaxID=1294296 RepID=A0A5C6V883_9FLAO|nr:16S rRNA (guanine(527)-N(7))-methyltransferase RsmG [Luteibaculum oceani]TXC81543.1 16S rRNA (guanine(527)-N(7))-methyltransferase RsmG [Luteibaculum oceani]
MYQEHFPQLSENQIEKLVRLEALYQEWNSKINVVSRKDIDNIGERHIIHSLLISKVYDFEAGFKVLDIGTGGGLPGIPLAIMYPECQFTLVDSIKKKITVVREICEELKIENVTAYHERVENIDGKFEIIVSRAVARVAKLLPWIKGKTKKDTHGVMPGGIYLLKGGDELQEELNEAQQAGEIIDLPKFIQGDFFETKKVVAIKKLGRQYF